MTHSLISWDQLKKNRTLMESKINSADYLRCMSEVKDRYPNAEIRQISETEWQLWDDLDCLSAVHGSHYACWREAWGK